MPTKQDAVAVFDQEFLDLRHRIIDTAAGLDRIDRSEGAKDVASDTRMKSLTEAMQMLNDGQADRARRIQMVFSDPHDPSWRSA